MQTNAQNLRRSSILRSLSFFISFIQQKLNRSAAGMPAKWESKNGDVLRCFEWAWSTEKLTIIFDGLDIVDPNGFRQRIGQEENNKFQNFEYSNGFIFLF